MTEKQLENEFPELLREINISQINTAMMEGVIKNCVKTENVETDELTVEETICLEKKMDIILKYFKY
jgi:hypothetical protein